MKVGDRLKRIENECVDCDPALGCLGDSCPYKNVPRFYCDKCGYEETLYEYDGEELCLECIAKRLPIVEGSQKGFI